MKLSISSYAFAAGIMVAMVCMGPAQAEDASELAHLVQNPIAKVISLPLQNNLTYGVGPEQDSENVLNIQPVLPFSLGDDWQMISRTIIPLVHQPELAPGAGSTDGLGDVSLSLYLSPAKSGSIIWGVGPSFTFATASHDSLGQGKFSVGLSAVALTIRGHWLGGALVTDVASVAGVSYRQSVHQMLAQPFINYNLPKGWYLVSSPMITANWEAPGGEQWTVPLGGGVGRTFHAGTQAMSAHVQAFGNVVRPHDAGNWTLRAQVQLLFPK